MKKFHFGLLLLVALLCFSLPYCKKDDRLASEGKAAKSEEKAVEAKTVVRANLMFNPINGWKDHLEKEKGNLEALKARICAEVDRLTKDVFKNADGELSYANWVRFVAIAEGIDALNDEWNEAYGNALDHAIDAAISTGSTDISPNDEQGKDMLSDIIEEQYLVFPEDIASVCFEEKFGFTSLRKCLNEKEADWLQSSDAGSFNAGESPTIQEEIEDEEYWTLISCDKKYTIRDISVNESMFDQPTGAKLDSILAVIGDIVPILGGLVDVAIKVDSLMKDCAGSTRVKEKVMREGIQIPGESNYIGYVMSQKGQMLDWSHQTYTKIKGKAKLYKQKNNGKVKRDRKNKASIAFCAKEWNNCEERDWPSDPGPYVKLHIDGKKGKVKVKHREPKALAIEKTYHFLQFKFGKNGNYVQGLFLLGTAGCSEW